jgi:hypothetical protein
MLVVVVLVYVGSKTRDDNDAGEEGGDDRDDIVLMK